ncbi:type II toxin-antitoxin system ParD family antitoxin [Sphingomonas sp.]|uniref:ribbon-helix-helix domain-containing protein n=1 Tax=Sphingomonas sp. TaxID=28214 RepID=UPI001B09AC29|nr:type II toxin-antitoxin system ParD family antitoxin [Sphingomonas sp.]MBO9711945.1 type II toxin-antitoxin system ParD family antitoxin [Sphingomonas sp.]
MGEFKRLSIELPDEMAEAVQVRVASGRYANESEVILAGLMALAVEEADAALDEDIHEDVEHWLRTKVAAVYDEWKANPSGGITIEEVRETLRQGRERGQAKA